MAPSTTQLTTQLRQIIWHHLDNNLVDNALFLAGRLQAIDTRSPDAVYLITLCYLRLKKYKLAVECSRSAAQRGANMGCTYLFAQACLAMGSFTEGVAALDRNRGLWQSKGPLKKQGDIYLRRQEPDLASIKCLFGKLLHSTGDIKRAISYYVEALELDPFMWDAFERLCETGTALHTSNIFRLNPDLVQLLAGPGHKAKIRQPETSNHAPLQSQTVNEHSCPSPARKCPKEHLKTASEISEQQFAGSNVHSSTRMAGSLQYPSTAEVRSNTSTQDSFALQNIHVPNGVRKSNQPEPPNAPGRRTRPQAGLFDAEAGFESMKVQRSTTHSRPNVESNFVEAQDSGKSLAAVSHSLKRSASGCVQSSQVNVNQELASAPQRRSNRLFKRGPSQPITTVQDSSYDTKKARATGTKGRTTTVGRVVSGNRKVSEMVGSSSKEAGSHLVPQQTTSIQCSLGPEEHDHDLEPLRWLLELLAKLGSGYYALCQYQCRAALQHFHELVPQHRETLWVLSQIGKAHYEQNNWTEAAKTFGRIRQMAPSRLDDLEIYSTVLWHLKNDSELAFLSHEVIDSNRLTPQAWCCLGNSFSLQREHDQALRCFKRATQIDESFAYGFTLQGHEHVANEEFDKALLAYRKAVGADHRHYNGWYGLAKVYEKLGKYDVAEKHYRAATSINSNNAILVCCVGVVLEKQQKLDAALHFYKQACVLSPQSTLVRFKKARVLVHMRRNEDALKELEVIKDLAPDEANVHFMLGRVLRKLHRNAEALKHFTIAMNLDPKAAAYIKETMESAADDFEHELDDDEEMSQ